MHVPIHFFVVVPFPVPVMTMWPIGGADFIVLSTLLCLCRGFSLPSNDGGPSSCNLPSGAPAFCVPLGKCQQINALLGNLQTPLPGDVRLLIKDSYGCPASSGQSGFHVCCPLNGIVPPLAQVPTTQKLGKLRVKKQDAKEKFHNIKFLFV